MTEQRRELSEADQQLVNDGLKAIKYKGDELINVPGNVHKDKGLETPAMRVHARDLGHVCLGMFYEESMPRIALQMTLDAWRVPAEEAGDS